MSWWCRKSASHSKSLIPWEHEPRSSLGEATACISFSSLNQGKLAYVALYIDNISISVVGALRTIITPDTIVSVAVLHDHP